ncbi:hypothetical protein BDW59DRAFT_137766 [Aspergillus cavernicola]|uniref:Secreted protein n=1 Tax=Aspergillus cavernicola TaxID=176166 RepID=A0ABR4J317_9EURO
MPPCAKFIARSILCVASLILPRSSLSPSQCTNTIMTQGRPRIEYNWIKGVETLEEYEPGGIILSSRWNLANRHLCHHSFARESTAHIT